MSGQPEPRPSSKAFTPTLRPLEDLGLGVEDEPSNRIPYPPFLSKCFKVWLGLLLSACATSGSILNGDHFCELTKAAATNEVGFHNASWIKGDVSDSREAAQMCSFLCYTATTTAVQVE